MRRVLANAGWNLLGTVLPLAAAALAVPFLVARLGTERFGLLSLVWVLIGTFGLFDLGLGRALTKLVAEQSGAAEAPAPVAASASIETRAAAAVAAPAPMPARAPSSASPPPSPADELSALCSTGWAFGCATGIAGGLLVAALALLGGWQGNVAPSLQDEAQTSLLLVAAGVPAAVGAALLRGVLEGLQRFKLLSAIRVPAGVLTFAAPCITAALTPRLDAAVAAIVLSRWIVLLPHALACARWVRISALLARRQWLAPLLRFGGWLTVSNVVAPVIVYLDRFVVGALLSATAVAYYAAPFEVVSRLLVLPVALTGALFPALAAAQRVDAAGARALRHRALKLVAVAVLPVALIGALLAAPLLHAWLGAAFADNGARPMQILLVGFACNALAQVPFVALHGHGLARQTALLHLCELPLYAALLFVAVRGWGLEGAAAAWALRGLVDLLALTALLRVAEAQPRGLPALAGR